MPQRGAVPLDRDTANNLRFLIGLRHEIEHQMTRSLDAYLSGRYQACALNYNDYLKKLFGKRLGIDAAACVLHSVHGVFRGTDRGSEPEAAIPERLRAFVADFDGALTHEEYNSPKYYFGSCSSAS